MKDRQDEPKIFAMKSCYKDIEYEENGKKLVKRYENLKFYSSLTLLLYLCSLQKFYLKAE